MSLMRLSMRHRAVLALLVAPAALAAALAGQQPVGAPVAANAASALQPALPTDGELGLSTADEVPPMDAVRGVVPAGAYPRAIAAADQVRRLTAQAAPEVAAADWRLEGPVNIGGRILDVAVDPVLKDTVYALPASGGVWVSKDAGKRFEPIWPVNSIQTMGAMAISPTGVLYVGTGEAGPGGGSTTYGGNGVYRSKDRGKTWEHIGLPTSNRIGRIAVDPKDEKRVFVAATGHLYQEGGERGLFRSVNGGDSWELVLEGDNARTGAVDVAIDPNDSQNLVMTMWENYREPDHRYYTGVGTGIYRSTDGGDTWARSGGPAFTSNPAEGRIGIAYAPSMPGRVYAYKSTEVGAFAGFFTSDDGGATFLGVGAGVELVTGGFVYGWWFGRLYVDPEDALHVFATGVNMAETKDGGLTWGNAPAGHADHHGLAYDAKVPGRLYVGNDGGVYRSDDNGASFEKAEYEPYSQLYSIDVDENDPTHIVAGLQDNGVNKSFGAADEPGDLNQWSSYHGGDGLAAVINPEDGSIYYGCSQYGACSVYFDGNGQSFNGPNVCALVCANRSNWFTPVELDPSNPAIVYTGGTQLYRSEDNGQNFDLVSGSPLDFSNGAGSEPNPLFRNYGTISALDVTDVDTGLIFVGTDDGNVWRSTDAGASFTQLESDLFVPRGYVSRLTIDLLDPKKIYLTFSGYRSADSKPHVLASYDQGDSWVDISSNLPDAPVNDVIVVGKDLLLGTDVGVFLSRDAGKKWLSVGSDLPQVPVTDIKFHKLTNRIYAATFGRSAWSTAYPGATLATTPTLPRPTQPAPPAAPRPQPKPQPLPATGAPYAVSVLALLMTGAAVVLTRRRQGHTA
ncbi:MAG TPA: hypothetical protein VNA14_10270 [Mycobacteriales bacterium]|nr:hypothetical protein [Mycobacteriales bacterium]